MNFLLLEPTTCRVDVEEVDAARAFLDALDDMCLEVSQEPVDGLRGMKIPNLGSCVVCEDQLWAPHVKHRSIINTPEKAIIACLTFPQIGSWTHLKGAGL